MNRILVFAFFVVLARLGGDVFAGEYAIATTYATFVFILVSFGIEKFVLREVSRQPNVAKGVFIVASRGHLLVWLVALPFALAMIFFWATVSKLHMQYGSLCFGSQWRLST